MTPTAQREPRLRLWIDGVEMELAGSRVLELEIDECTDAASSLQMTFDMNPVGDAGAGDWDLLAPDPATGQPFLQLMSRITVGFLLLPDADQGEAIAQNVFDGYVTEMHPRFGPARAGDSRLEVRGLDAACLMHFQTVTKTWAGKTDAQIATAIFQKYGFKTDAASIEPTAPIRDLGRAATVQRWPGATAMKPMSSWNRSRFKSPRTTLAPAGAISTARAPTLPKCSPNCSFSRAMRPRLLRSTRHGTATARPGCAAGGWTK